MTVRQFNVYDGLTSVRVAANSNQTGSYDNGPSLNGTNSTFTYTTGVLIIDSITVLLGDSVLLIAQTSSGQNGIYICVQQGAVGISAILKRRDDFQSIEQLKAGQFITVEAGSLAGSLYTMTAPLPQRLGIDAMLFVSVLPSNALSSSITNPDTNANLVSFSKTVGFAALATGGSVVLVASSGTKRYRVKQLSMNQGGTNFSGVGGDRLGQVTDGTNVYSLIPAASLQTLVNAIWGSTALPLPASIPVDTASVPGASIVFKYSGGTLDYTAGSVVISGIAERIA